MHIYTQDIVLASSDFHNSNLFSEHLGTHCNENVIWASVLRLSFGQ